MLLIFKDGVRCSSVVISFAHGAMDRRLYGIGSILHGVDILSYFSIQPVLHDWCNKGYGMCYPVWDDAYKSTLAANRKE